MDVTIPTFFSLHDSMYSWKSSSVSVLNTSCVILPGSTYPQDIRLPSPFGQREVLLWTFEDGKRDEVGEHLSTPSRQRIVIHPVYTSIVVQQLVARCKNMTIIVHPPYSSIRRAISVIFFCFPKWNSDWRIVVLDIIEKIETDIQKSWKNVEIVIRVQENYFEGEN